TLQNYSTSPQCITINVTTAAGAAESAVYLGSFDPNNPQLNYLADGGANAGTITYAVTIPPLATFLVTINGVNNTGDTYTLDVSGCGTVVVSGVSPNVGPTAGGTPITIHGAGFLATPAVTIGGNPATNIVLVDSNTITAVTPAGAAGPADVTVTNT